MKDRMEANDWLALLEWALELAFNPSPARLLESFESWEYRNRLRPQLRQLQRSGLLEQRGSTRSPSWRLTARGRLAADGGIDPVSRWSRKWDGRWRLLLFDLPARQKVLRLRLWRWLRGQRFGLLQRSIWIVPDRIDEAAVPLHHLKLTPKSLTVIEGIPAPSTSHEDIVQSAWDFPLINRRYQAAMEAALAGRRLAMGARSTERRHWLAEERLLWLEAVAEDPFLPARLLPGDYLGQKALRERRLTYSLLGKAAAERHNR
jgi:phenylacetic acid degradation operon negative regulatory protein